MAGSWAFERSEVLPASANTVVDYVESPAFEHAQPFTISFDRGVPPNHTDNSGLRAQITYRTEHHSRTVVCDWRGQATLTANQVSVRGISYQPKNAAYAAGVVSQRHSVMLGLGSVAKSSVLLTGSEIGIANGAFPEPIETLVPRMATRLLLRAALVDGGVYGDILEDLIGAGRLKLAHLAGERIFHSELLSSAHFAQGIELGEAESYWLSIPADLNGGSGFVAFTPVYELAL